MSDAGKLCYKAGGSDAGELCYKSGGGDAGKLIFKAADPGGDITIAVVSSQDQVGPIKSCGNTHSVALTFGVTTGHGSVSIVVAPATQTIQGSTASEGCAYPEENPPMTLSVAAIQPSTGVVKTTTISIANVATGSFAVTVTVDANGWLTAVSGQEQ